MKAITVMVPIVLLWSIGAKSQIYVSTTGSGTKDGSTWSNAISGNDTTTTIGYSQLQVLLKTLRSNQIWIAAGTYKIEKSSQTTASEKTFNIANGQIIYGGFYGTTGTEGDITQRDSTSYNSILSGVNLPASTSATNEYSSVVTFIGTIGSPITSSTILNGFTITNGRNGRSVGQIGAGAGMYLSFASPVLTHVFVTNNFTSIPTNLGGSSSSGGGMYLINGSHPRISYSKFSIDSSGNGGGIFISNTASTGVITLIADTFITDKATARGGAISSDDSLHIEDCYFTGGSSGIQGGAIYGSNGGTTASLYIKRSTFFNNSTTATSGTSGGAICWGTDLPTINMDSCKFDGNTTSTSGGAVCIVPATGPYLLNVANSQFLNNRATTSGGAVTINLAGNTTGSAGYFKNNVFYNDFGGIGGGIYATGTGKMTIYGANLVFDGCSVTAAGGYSNGSALHLLSTGGTGIVGSIFTNCTFAKNFDGQVIYLGNSATGNIDSIRNCIFLGNRNYMSGGGIGITNTGSDFMSNAIAGNKIYISNSLFDTSRVKTISNGSNIPLFSGGSNISQPDTVLVHTFLSPDNGPGADGIWMTADDGLHELVAAQTVDVGNNAYLGTGSGFNSIPTDITSVAVRIQGGIVDMGAYEGPAIVLPIELVGFTARIVDDKYVQLDWQTASESNNAFFTVERSSGDGQWENMGKVNGAGNSSQLLSYGYLDENAVQGMSYYRILQTDFDGNVSLSPVRMVTLELSRQDEIKIYPNPAANTIEVLGNNLRMIEILDRTGKLCLQQRITNPASTTVNVNALSAGIYFIRITGNDGRSISKELFKE